MAFQQFGIIRIASEYAVLSGGGIMMNSNERTDTSGGALSVGGLLSAVKATAVGYAFLAVCFAVVAAVYTFTSFPAGMLKPVVSAVGAISAFLCGVLSVRGAVGFGWLHGLTAGAMYSAMRFLGAAVMSKGFGINPALLPLLAIGIALGALGGIVGINLRK